MGHLFHLARRFLGSVWARPLSPQEQAVVAGLLRPAERPLFWRQGAADQRHGLRSARALLEWAPARIDLARAALLHDVGKGTVRLGPLGRSLATALGLLHLPAPGALGEYLAHERRGADELAAAGAEPTLVAYAGYHHGRRPAVIAQDDWDLLRAADRV